MRRVVVAAVLAAWVSSACSGDEGGSDAGSGYGTVPTTTTVPASAEVAVDGDVVDETGNTRTTVERASINGVVYPAALVMEPHSYAARRDWRVELGLGRDFRRFRGDLGIPDDQASSTAYRVDVVLDDGAPALSVDVRFGETRTIDLDVTNVLRIRIVLSPVTFGDIAIGNPRLVR